MIKIDLHTHSRASHDGGISLTHYTRMLEHGTLDAVAITDHKTIEYAKTAKRDATIAEAIIVGQEIKSTEGEIIGLFLKAKVEDGQSAEDTIAAIKKQHGFIIIPHPEDPHRSGMSREDMETIVHDIDALEVYNGRQLHKPNPELRLWAKQHTIPIVASSDAHSPGGVGWTFTLLESIPKNAAELREAFQRGARTVYDRPPLRTYFSPKYNRVAKLWRRV